MDIASSKPLPVEVFTVPLRPEEEGASIRFALIVQDRDNHMPFILLRQTFQASIYLGCLQNRAGIPLQWVEVWTQDPARLKAGLHPQLSRTTNGALDNLWQEQSRYLRELNPNRFLYTGWEDKPIAPLVVDVVRRTAGPLRDPANGRELFLCTDDAFLHSFGLPPYRESLDRLFWARLPGDGGPLYRFDQDAADAGSGVRRLDSRRVFNRSGGPLLLRPLAPLSLSEYSDLLSGKPWDRARLPAEVIAQLPAIYARLQNEEEVAHGASLFLRAREGGETRALETLFLKINLLAQMIEQVERWTSRQQTPFLHLTPASFRVHLHDTATGLPGFWASCVDLAETVAAWRVPLGETDQPYFVSPELRSASIYQPRSATSYQQASGTARVRESVTVNQTQTQVDLTLATTGSLAATPSDLVHLILAVDGISISLYGHPDWPKELPVGEVRIRTVPQTLTAWETAALKRTAGLPLPDSPYEVLPGLTSPYDLYALAIMGTEILCAGSGKSLPVTVDELLSLAAQVATGYDRSVALPWRLERLLQREPQWLHQLGSHGLVRRDAEGQTDEPVPMNLWAQVLASLVRMLPGVGPDSHCSGFGDAPGLALERAFHPSLGDLNLLQTKLKSILLGDASQNAEVQDVLAEVRRDLKVVAR